MRRGAGDAAGPGHRGGSGAGRQKRRSGGGTGAGRQRRPAAAAAAAAVEAAAGALTPPIALPHQKAQGRLTMRRGWKRAACSTNLLASLLSLPKGCAAGLDMGRWRACGCLHGAFAGGQASSRPAARDDLDQGLPPAPHPPQPPACPPARTGLRPTTSCRGGARPSASRSRGLTSNQDLRQAGGRGGRWSEGGRARAARQRGAAAHASSPTPLT